MLNGELVPPCALPAKDDAPCVEGEVALSTTGPDSWKLPPPATFAPPPAFPQTEAFELIVVVVVIAPLAIPPEGV